MGDLKQRIASLSPEKRALMEMGLKRRPAEFSIPRRTSSGPAPLSFSQNRLWLLDQIEPGDAAYNVFRGIVLRGPLDVPALERSLQEIVRRHTVLRTTFPVVEGRPVQCIQPVSFGLRVSDFSHLPAEDRRLEAEKFAAIEAERRFDLSSDSLFRGSLVRLAPEEHFLILTTHHIAVDGYSVGILLHELVTMYAAFARGNPNPLADPLIQYEDYAVWERQYLNDKKMSELLGYWKRQLSGMPELLRLPVERHRPPVQTSHGARHYFRIPGAPLGHLKALARQQNATLFMALLAAFQLLLSKYCGQRDFGVGSPMACREIDQITDLIGCFSNTLVLRANLNGSPCYQEVLRRVRETVLNALSHQLMPFDKLIEALNPRRDASRTPLIQVNFRLLSTSLPAGAGGLTFEYLEMDNHRCKFDLAFELVETPQGLTGYVEYSTDLFRPESIVWMVSDFEGLLGTLATQPEVPLNVLTIPLRFGGPHPPQLGHVKRKPTSLRPARTGKIGID